IDSVTANSNKGFGAGCRGPDLVRLAQEEIDHFWDDHVIVYDQDLLPSGGHPAISAMWKHLRREHGFSGMNVQRRERLLAVHVVNQVIGWRPSRGGQSSEGLS